MAIYDRPTHMLMREWAEKELTKGVEFTVADVVHWFSENYPLIKANTIYLHVQGHCVNNPTHRKHNPRIRPGTGWDLFMKLDHNRYRLYDPEHDPRPVYAPELALEGEQSGADSPEGDFDREIEDVDAERLDELREFAYERDLQNFLAKNITLIEPGLKIYEEDGFSGIEFPAGGRRIDLLAVDKDGALVVIELKASQAYDRVIGQTARYMAWVEQNLDNSQPARGIIIAKSISNDLRLAASITRGITLMEYSLKFEVKRVEQQK